MDTISNTKPSQSLESKLLGHNCNNAGKNQNKKGIGYSTVSIPPIREIKNRSYTDFSYETRSTVEMTKTGENL